MPRQKWRIDYSKPNSFRNWVDPDKLDLTCESKVLIGFLGAFFFIGFALSSAVIPRIADLYGRKRIYTFSMVLNLLFGVFLFFSKSIYFSIFSFFFIGVSSGGRVVVGTMYVNEFLPERNQSFIITLLLALDASQLLFEAIYYYYFRDWEPLFMFFIFFYVMVVLAVLQLPESPKYLYAKKKFDEARLSLQTIAYHNKGAEGAKLVESITFDLEELGRSDGYKQLSPETQSANLPLTQQAGQKIELKGDLKELW